ncbi:MAG: DHA2 family efflux MFS transporter permease subunit [Anaerolineae bacterium]
MTDRRVLSTTGMENLGVLVAVGVGSFASAAVTSMVSTVLPVITEALASPVSLSQWVITGYLLAVSALLLSAGYLGDLYGHKRVYLIGAAVFTLGSGLSSLATSVQALIAFRLVQGMGAAALYATAPAILTRSFAPERRGRVLGLQATMTYLGLTVGPSLGGWLAQTWGWRAVFLSNVPLGLLALAFAWVYVPALAGSGTQRRFDWAGALLFATGLVALLQGLNRGPRIGWGSWQVLTLLGAAMVLTAAFVLRERRAPTPLLDLALFQSRTFTATGMSASLNYTALTMVTFLMPFYLQRGRGFSPAEAGLLLTAQPIVMALAAPISGALSDRIGTRIPAALGMAVLALGLLLMSRLGGDTPVGLIAALLAVTGLGTGIFISPNNSALMGSAPGKRQGTAGGVLATARNVGMAVGTGIAGAIYAGITAQAAVGDSALIYVAVGASFLVAAGIALVGAATSMVRGAVH